jgi:phospholipid-binding lipoprotein MlaA
MRKHTWNRILLLFLFTAVLSAGCAHKAKTSPQTAPAELQSEQNRRVNTAGTEQNLSDTDVEDLDDDFFEDEFEEDIVQVSDPLSPWNRAMFTFNDKLYFTLLRPLAIVYRELIPDVLRSGVRNFFRNLTAPIRMVNCILQGKREAFATETTRFILNTTVGVLGLGNPADSIPELVRPDDEDFGQTLGKYGIGNGFYIVWPILGPSTLRDTVGKLGDWFLNPISYIDSQGTSVAVWSFDKVSQTSYRIGDYEALKKAAIDPYTALRDVYLQYRETKVQK